jgi:hypothetical protein
VQVPRCPKNLNWIYGQSSYSCARTGTSCALSASARTSSCKSGWACHQKLVTPLAKVTTGNHSRGGMMYDACCLIVDGLGWLRIVEQSSGPNFLAPLCARGDQRSCGLATTTRPGVAALRALIINKQHNQASRVVAVLSFDPDMPRAPGTWRWIWGPKKTIGPRSK